MNSIKGFNPKRFFLLIRNDLFLNRAYLLIYAGVIATILILISTLWSMIHPNPQLYQKIYPVIVFWGGIVIIEKIFKGLHNDMKGAAWLTLPASALEKFMSRLILLTILLPLALIVLTFLISVISEPIHLRLFGSSHGIFNPFDKKMFLDTASCIIIQSPFIMGAIYFKKNSGPKTFLAIVGYLILLTLIAQVFYIVIYSHYSNNLYDLLNPNGIGAIKWIIGIMSRDSGLSSTIHWLYKIFSWCIIAPVFWVTAYFCLKEKEV